jgi:ecotin
VGSGVITLLALVSMLVFMFPAFAADNMKAFPPADEGMTRYVISLQEQDDETALKIELIIGKTVKTDARNSYFFGGTLETEDIPGWGFNRYILRKLGPMAGTLIAVDPDAPQVERFIRIGGEPRLLRYNSRLPLVVYVPAGVEVRYRLWRAELNVTRARGG